MLDRKSGYIGRRSLKSLRNSVSHLNLPNRSPDSPRECLLFSIIILPSPLAKTEKGKNAAKIKTAVCIIIVGHRPHSAQNPDMATQ